MTPPRNEWGSRDVTRVSPVIAWLLQQETHPCPVAGRRFMAMSRGYNGGLLPNYEDIWETCSSGTGPGPKPAVKRKIMDEEE